MTERYKMEVKNIMTVILLVAFNSRSTASNPAKFPPKFKFGVSTAAYQVEGGWNAADKGESIWDRITHQRKNFIFDGSTGDVSADSYHHYKEDVALLRMLEVDFYRFSISWPRILPDGFSDRVSSDGIRYYNNVINELLHYNITPVITMYHWDLPQTLQDLGGWTNPIMADYFSDYARVLFDNFGDRVKTWITFNEPKNVCLSGYDNGQLAPAVTMYGIASYLCTHTILRAHGMVYRMYDREFRKTENGIIGISLDGDWMEPESVTQEDKEAADRVMQFTFGWFAHPIFSITGDYPPIMRQIIDAKSSKQGYSRSRLPVFSPEEVDMIRESADFFGLNHYTTRMVTVKSVPKYRQPSFADDVGVRTYQKSSWPHSNSTWLKVVPWGFRKTLNWVKDEYHNPIVLVTENGVSSGRGFGDGKRIQYLHSYLRSLLRAISEDQCKVVGYSYWSLIDNFEWTRGYSERFGLFEVDYTSANKKRTARSSAAYYRYITKFRRLPAIHMSEYDDEQLFY